MKLVRLVRAWSAAAVLAAGCAIGANRELEIEQTLLAGAMPGVPARVLTLQIEGRRGTMNTDWEAVALLERCSSVMDLQRGAIGTNHVLVLVSAGMTGADIATCLGDSYVVRVVRSSPPTSSER